MEKPDALWVAVFAAAIGSFLIIVNEWAKVIVERKKQKKKLLIWNALEQRGPTQTLLTIDDLSKETRIGVEKIKPLIYEMLQEGTVSEAPMPGKFMRHRA